MPVKDLVCQGDYQNEDAMDVEPNTNVNKAADPAHPPLQSPIDYGHPKSNVADPQIEELSIDEEDPARPSGTIDYTFNDIEDPRSFDLKKELRLLSDPVIIRCLPWRILLVFTPACQRSTMGMFLQCNDNSPTANWTCGARATLEVLSQTKRLSKTHSIMHSFAAKENDWGYQTFISYEELFNPENGYVVNKKLHARIQVEADAPHGTEWDSKKFTGFVGLKNQGATCYLNSVLQALYCTNALRKAVFQMPTESDEISTSVPLALQRTFFDLQCSVKAVVTEKLTRSFGWTTWDSFMQHDAQELCRVLLDNMECKMKGTDVEAIIPKLFCGKMISYIRCKDVDYESKREEQFYDIQLKVKGNCNVHDAFKEYVQVETLDSDNKYDAGTFGLQDAEKGIKFLRFPPVLYLQLMRFQYDFQSGTNVKINDRFEFPYDLDLSDYLVQDPEKMEEEPRYTKYFLQAVLVHSGDHHGGHYVVYINPRGDNKWYQFDDDVVSSCRPKDAIEMNYGNSDDPLFRASSNAYMLVYIACDAREEVLCPVTDDMIPFSLSNRFREEHSVEEKERRVKDHAHEFATVNVLLDEDFYGFEGPELLQINEVPIRSLRIHRRELDECKLNEAIASFLQWPLQKISLWRAICQKSTCAVEFSRNITTDFPLDSVLTLWARRREQAIWVGSPTSDCSLCFFKYFDSNLCTLCYCGHADLPTSASVEALPALLNKRVGLPPTTPLIFYHQDSARLPKPVDLAMLSRKLKHGEIIYFHVDTSQAKDSSLAGQMLHPNSPADINMETAVVDNNHSQWRCDLPNASLHLRKVAVNGHLPSEPQKSLPLHEAFVHYFVSSSMMVDILLVDKLRKSDPGILIRVSPELSYWRFAELASGYLSGRPDHLQFFPSHPTPTSGSGVSASVNKTANVPTQDLHVNAVNPSPLSNDLGNGNSFSPSGGASLISEQSRAAKASGFSGASANLIGALASAAHQGLVREPPGPPVPSATTATLRGFLSLPSTVSVITVQCTAAASVASQDRPPLCVSRYSSIPRVTPSPFSNHNLHVPAPRRVYYAHTALPVSRLECLKQIQVAFFGPKLTDRLDLGLSVPSSGAVADILDEVRSHVTLSGSGRLRLMEIRWNRIAQIYDENYPLAKIDDAMMVLQSDINENLRNGLRVEEVPQDEENLQQDDLVINAAHFNKVLNETFGVPFTVRLRNGESYSDVKKRIRERLDVVNDKEFDAWNFALVFRNKFIAIPDENSVMVDTIALTRDTCPGPKPWLGVEHEPPKRPRYAPSEKSIKIHN
ncbi:ubiquitin carboxyl terminal hydrolase 7 [Echinococcus multilocularis]|uniref:Ubiquitin carboxyl-terminal hydrolase 7 n=1 Tax=Echinococcus multilocularis TaxID=6211 RepID=A0A068YCW6_ECHMU|nr:ubiquitin carboxyl terminal hydrolase 7 [Echinococcus multilocularis]